MARVALPGGETSNEITLQVPAPSVRRWATTRNAQEHHRDLGARQWPRRHSAGYRLIAGPDARRLRLRDSHGGHRVRRRPRPGHHRLLPRRRHGVNAAGQSGPSSEVTVVMPEAGACDPAPPVPLTTFTFSGYLSSLAWPSIAGPATTKSVAVGAAPERDGFGLITACRRQFTRAVRSCRSAPRGLSVKASSPSCGGQSPDNPVTVLNDGSAPAGPRTPDPAPGTLIPSLPGYGAGVVEDLARARPDLVRASCLEFGGNNRFLFEAGQEVRKRDTRWGLEHEARQRRRPRRTWSPSTAARCPTKVPAPTGAPVSATSSSWHMMAAFTARPPRPPVISQCHGQDRR